MAIQKAHFACGCFWCMENDLRGVSGVTDVISGYIGEDNAHPTYEDHHGFREAVEVSYDDTQTNFKKLTQFFLDHIDPTDASGQFHDRGESYKTAIFFGSDDEKKVAGALLAELGESGIYDKPIVVEIFPEKTFYKAEEYHQRYAEKNPVGYVAYRSGSGHEDFTARTCAIREEKKINWKD